MSFHSAETAGSIHISYNFSYANQAARLAATPASTDVGKVARQTDNETYWILLDDSPLTWHPIVGGVSAALSTKTTTYVAVASDNVILADATGGAFTITLPAASAKTGQILAIKKIDASANAVTISRAGADTIDGATSVSLPAQYDVFYLISDGTSSWYIF